MGGIAEDEYSQKDEREQKTVDENPQPDLFAPVLSSDALMGPFLLTARLFTTGIFSFYIVNEVIKIHAPNGLFYLAALVQFVGIILVALGYKTRFTALLLAVCILTSLLFRPSFGLDGYQVTGQKDLAIAGVLLFMFAYGPGPLSLDTYRRRGKSTKMNESSYDDFFAPVLLNSVVMGPLLFAGRLLSTVVFFIAGSFKTLHTPVMQAYMVKHNSHVPINLIYLAILTQLVAPTLVLLGYKTRYGALALSGFCIIATVLFHSEFGNPSEVEQFLLDFATAGGFLFMFANGPGPLSLDARLGRAKRAGEASLTIKTSDVSAAGSR